MLDFAVFKIASIRRIFLAQLVSQICDKLMLVGIMWFIAERLSPEWAPWFVGVSALPHLLLATLAPSAIRRLGGPLPAVIVTDLIRAALFVAFGAAAALGAFAGADSQLLIALFVLGLSSNLLGAIFNPAILSLPPQLTDAPELREKTTAAIESCFSLSTVLAPMAAIWLYAAAGLSGLLILNGLSYGLAAWLESQVTLVPGPEASPLAPSAPASPWAVLRADRLVAAMLLSFLVFNLALGPIIVFLPLYARGVYGGTISTLAWLETALGVGTLAGSLALSVVQLPGTLWRKINASLLLISGAYLAFTLSRSPVLGVAAVAALGVLLAAVNVSVLSYFQARPRSEEIPAIMSLVNLISVASLPISMSIAGLLLAYHSVRPVAIGCALAALGVAALTRALPRIVGAAGVRPQLAPAIMGETPS